MKKPTQSEEMLLHFADEILDLTTQKRFRKFDGFIPQNPELYDDEDFIFTDVSPRDLRNPVDICIYTPGQADGHTKAKQAGQIAKLKSITSKELRKLTGQYFLNPYHLEICFDDYPKIADGFLQYTKNGMKYVEIGGYETTPYGKRHAVFLSQCLLGYQFNIENQCYVYLRPDGSEFGFKYPINDLRQLKELFSLREIPDGYKRRAALRHWVAKHLRRKPSNPEEKIEVKDYLRGKETFEWCGISGRIFVN